MRNFSWSRIHRQQQSWLWTDGLDSDDHERPIRLVLCFTEGAVQREPYHPKEPPGRTRRCAESVPAVQVFPLQLATLDLRLSPASLQLVVLKLSLMPASLTSRSTRSSPALPSSPYITQANMKICSHSPHLSKNPSMQWKCCGSCSASPLPPPHPTTPPLRLAETTLGLSIVPQDPRKCEEFRCSCNSIKLKSVIYPFIHDSQLHVATQLFVGQLHNMLGNKDHCGYLKRHSNPNSCRNNSTAEDPSASEHACLWTVNQSSV